MRDSKLDLAEQLVSQLKGQRLAVEDYVQGLLVDQMGLNFEGVPAALANGFLKTLLDRLQ